MSNSAAKNKKVRVAIIGCGRIGSLLEEDPLRGKPCTHAGAFAAAPEAEIAAGCDIDRSRLEKFGARWQVSRLYTSYEDMLRREKPDIVAIAAWTHLHCPMTLAAARAGVKGIFCEKPIALNARDAKKMTRACAEKKIPLVINHERRWDFYYQKAREIIRSGQIGKLKTIIGHALSGAPGKLPVAQYGGGGFFHDGTHLTDLLLYFGGPAAWVSGHEVRPHGPRHIEETAHAMIRFRNGAMGFIEGGGARQYFGFELDIQGTAGRILIGNAGRSLHLTRDSKRFTGFHELEPAPFPAPEQYVSPFTLGATDIIRCVRGGAASLSSGADGLKALELILAAYRSAAAGGKRVRLR